MPISKIICHEITRISKLNSCPKSNNSDVPDFQSLEHLARSKM